MRPRNVIASLLAAAAMAAPVAGQAGESCEGNIVIFSGLAGGPKPNSNAIKCIVEPGDDPDGRIINPLSNAVSLRYTADFGAATPEIVITLDGLGFESVDVTLERGQFTTGDYLYDSDEVLIPDGPSASGCLTATFVIGEYQGEPITEQTRFHTIDSSCPLG